MKLTTIFSITLVVLAHYVSGHARLLQPPSRSSMWRFGFDNPPDYTDNQGFCGGIKVSFYLHNNNDYVLGQNQV